MEVLFKDEWRFVKTRERKQSNKTAELCCNQLGYRNGVFVEKGISDKPAWFDIINCGRRHMTIFHHCKVGTIGKSYEEANDLYIKCYGINGKFYIVIFNSSLGQSILIDYLLNYYIIHIIIHIYIALFFGVT